MHSCPVGIAFVLDHSLMDYRVPFFNMLVERGYSVTVFHSGDSTACSDNSFEVQAVPVFTFKSLLNFRSLPNLDRFDIVVCMQNIRMVNLWTLTLNPFKRYKVVHWGIGVSSARGLSLNVSLVSKIRNELARRASAQVLYSEFPLPLFSNDVLGKTFIANNTVYNNLCSDMSQLKKDTFLFIGSLNERKGLDLLIRAFAMVLDRAGNRISRLVIIGEGHLKCQLIKLTQTLDISEYVFFAGNVSDSQEKLRYFKNALVSISPLQAGLSVLESFSFGVPFICFSTAISGGEHLNIQDGVNGYLVSSVDELAQRMMELEDKPELAVTMGKNAYKFYMENRQMKHMVDGFVSCFEFVIKKPD